MSHFSFNRKKAKLKQLLGIRARLALLAVILVAPLMLVRARSLEETRARQVANPPPGISRADQASVSPRQPNPVATRLGEQSPAGGDQAISVLDGHFDDAVLSDRGADARQSLRPLACRIPPRNERLPERQA